MHVSAGAAPLRGPGASDADWRRAWAAAEDHFFDARFCDVCYMWLNGPTQMDNHLIGKKHRKNSELKRKRAAKAQAIERNKLLPECAPVDLARIVAHFLVGGPGPSSCP